MPIQADRFAHRIEVSTNGIYKMFLLSFCRAVINSVRCGSRIRSRRQAWLTPVQGYEQKLLLSAFSDFIDPSPSPGNRFGDTVVALSSGNVVITSPYDDVGGTDAGAVYLFNGATGALISTLRGSSANDHLGAQNGVIALPNGNFLICSGQWDNGTIIDAGAVTFGSGTTGVSGVISTANSLVGSSMNDYVGGNGVEVLTNGNYVVCSTSWSNGSVFDVGAATWGSKTTGVKGTISAANSLIGSTANDRVGSLGIKNLTNGNYLVMSHEWNNGAATKAGAVTWGNGTVGVKGIVSSTNSLVGSTTNDQVGYTQTTALSNGNYVVASRSWDNGAIVDAGAVTYGIGTIGVSGVISSANSLVGSRAGDAVGEFGVTALTNGNYVVSSPNWDNGVIANAGAATWGSGTIGVKGVVTSTNSLVGSKANDMVGIGGVYKLTNGNYVVDSYNWDNGAAADAGAVTWGNGATGVVGVVSSTNSLVGSTSGDKVGLGNGGGYPSITALTNGNYVVSSYLWDNGVATDAGAATWGNGTTGITGAVSAANSLVGSGANNNVGVGGTTALANGNYVVNNYLWDNGAISNVGAATWGSGTTGVSGVVSAANSLVGSTANDFVGTSSSGVIALTNGNYVVSSSQWDNGGVLNVGASTWGSGTVGVKGVISSTNSLIGNSANDLVGSGGATALTNGNYVVRSWNWSSNKGAATFGAGTFGVTGIVSSANSLVGGTNGDQVGREGILALANGRYVVMSRNWKNGGFLNAGAATVGSATIGVAGVVSAANSLVGITSNTGLEIVIEDSVNSNFIARFVTEGSGRVRVSS